MATKLQPTTEAAAAANLSNEEILRYSRHLIMPEVGMEGQLKLAKAKVLMIGAGGLGAPLGLYLAAAAVFMVLAPFRSRWRLLVGGLAGGIPSCGTAAGGS